MPLFLEKHTRVQISCFPHEAAGGALHLLTGVLTLCIVFPTPLFSAVRVSVNCCWFCLFRRAARGALHFLAGVLTLGIVFLTPLFRDTAHHCPRCGRQVAVAKIM